MVVPEHLGIIMDGNVRWAHARGLDRSRGHLEGLRSAWKVSKAAGEAGVKYLTLFGSEEDPVFHSPSVRRLLGRFAARIKGATGMTVLVSSGAGRRSDGPWDPEIPGLGLLVRTGGERKLDDTLLDRSAYADLVFVNKPWPEFGAEDLLKALRDHAARLRGLTRLGRLLNLSPAQVRLN